MVADGSWFPELSTLFSIAVEALLDEDRRQSEQETAADRFHRVLVKAPLLAVILDRDRRISWANTAACEYLDTDLEALQGVRLTDIGVRVTRVRRPVPATDQEWVDVVGLGGVRHLTLRRFPLDDGAFGLVALDLSGLVNAARTVDETEKRFRSFMEHAPVAAVLKDEAGRYVWANPAYFDTYRIRPDNFLGTTVGDHLPPQALGQADVIEGADREVLASGHPMRSTHHFTRPDGSTGTDVGWRFALPNGDGTTLMGGVFLDITEATSVKAQLSASESRYRVLFGNSEVAMVALGLDGRVKEMNAGAESLLRRSQAAVRGRAFEECVSPDSKEAIAQQWSALLAGRRSSPVEVILLTGAGTARTVRLTGVLMRDPHGEPDQVVYILSSPSSGAHDKPEAGNSPSVKLSKYQAKVLELVATGLTDTVIAQRLSLTRDGVTHHLRWMSTALDTNTRTELVMRATHLGLLDISVWPPVVPTHRITQGRRS